MDLFSRSSLKFFFAKEAISSIASAVAKPLVVDMATKNHTRPNCARVKIEVDLVAKLPHRIKINEKGDVTGNIKSKWIKIQYDHKPKYCKECGLQGYDEETCWDIHPELFKKKKELIRVMKKACKDNKIQR
ncbi:hypothetical protein FXO37_12058 [Capsicum annuum]|nr:hypothetical protein FXO37_12058 [Capsicum annuum]